MLTSPLLYSTLWCLSVCTPGGCGHVDGCFGVVVPVVEASEKLCAHLQSTCATQTLHGSNLVVTEMQTVSLSVDRLKGKSSHTVL